MPRQARHDSDQMFRQRERGQEHGQDARATKKFLLLPGECGGDFKTDRRSGAERGAGLGLRWRGVGALGEGVDGEVAFLAGFHFCGVGLEHNLRAVASGDETLDGDAFGRVVEFELEFAGVVGVGEPDLDAGGAAGGNFDGGGDEVGFEGRRRGGVGFFLRWFRRRTAGDDDFEFLRGDEMPVGEGLHHVVGGHGVVDEVASHDAGAAFEVECVGAECGF